MRLRSMERDLSAVLHTPLRIFCSGEAEPPASLSTGERQRLADFETARRRSQWLVGRRALKTALKSLDRSDDTAALTLPDPQVSLTHSVGKAFAVAAACATTGIGIDVETIRTVKPQLARWFLRADELRWLEHHSGPAVSHHLVRLWTIKEAAFKSHPDNAGMPLCAFQVERPSVSAAHDVSVTDGLNIRVATRRYDRAWLSIAVAGEAK